MFVPCCTCLLTLTVLCGCLSCTVLPPGHEFTVNLPSELMEIVVETRYLEQLGFPIPGHARNMALQEEKLLSYQDGLKHILQRYRSCIEALQPAEVSQSDTVFHQHTPTTLLNKCTLTNITHTYVHTHTFVCIYVQTCKYVHSHTHIHVHARAHESA